MKKIVDFKGVKTPNKIFPRGILQNKRKNSENFLKCVENWKKWSKKLDVCLKILKIFNCIQFEKFDQNA